MASHMNCPECEHPFGFAPALVGKTIRCRQCQFTFTVKAAPLVAPTPTSSAPPTTEPPAPPPAPPPPNIAEPPPMPAKVVVDRDEVRRTRRREEEDRRVDDDEYDRPNSKRRRDRDDEQDDDRPRSRSRSRNNRYADDESDVNDNEQARSKRGRQESSGRGAMLGIIIGVGLVLLLGGGLLAYAVLPGSKSSSTEPVIATNTPNRPNDPNINVRPAWPNNPKQVEPPPNLNDLLNKGPKANPFPNPPAEVKPPKKQPPAEAPLPTLRGLSERKELTLDGAADTAVAGGGGKFLCVLQPTAKKLAIIDIAQGKVVKTLDVDGQSKMAAGRQYCYVLDVAGGEMERWDFTKLERSERGKFSDAGDVTAMAMGADSEGPLVVTMRDRKSPHMNSQVRYFDAKTYAEMNYRVEGQGCPHGLGLTNRPILLAVSANGKEITASTKDWPMGPQIERLSDGVVTRSWKHIPTEPMRPCNDGAHLCSNGQLYDYSMKPVGKKQGDVFNPTWFIPAVDGNGYVSLGRGQERRRVRDGKLPLLMEIRQTGSEQLLLDVGQVPDLTHDPLGSPRQGFGGQVFYFHGQKMLAMIAANEPSRVVLYRVTLAW